MPGKKKKGKKKKLPPPSLRLECFTVQQINPASLPVDHYKANPTVPNPGGMGPCNFSPDCQCKGFVDANPLADKSTYVMWTSATCMLCKHAQMYHSKKAGKKGKKKKKAA